MRKMALSFAVIAAFISVYKGIAIAISASEPPNLSVVSVDSWEAQVRAGNKDMPIMVTENPI
jgi:hypothetical protein